LGPATSAGEERPAVVVVPGSGGDRSELLGRAAALSRRGFVVLTLTPPSTADPPPAASGEELLSQARRLVVAGGGAGRRAVDALEPRPGVDPAGGGYLGGGAGAKLGAFVAGSDERVGALALLSAGADPVSAFVEHAPPELRER